RRPLRSSRRAWLSSPSELYVNANHNYGSKLALDRAVLAGIDRAYILRVEARNENANFDYRSPVLFSFDFNQCATPSRDDVSGTATVYIYKTWHAATLWRAAFAVYLDDRM